MTYLAIFRFQISVRKKVLKNSVVVVVFVVLSHFYEGVGQGGGGNILYPVSL